ncbi:MAG TPA: ATP-binding cassette domain-containing protein [Symbiobacteriaceae bacterium]|nr:ATP-binding cassette domain-containing protein [Symbiobacteriaceae bacterium]
MSVEIHELIKEYARGVRALNGVTVNFGSGTSGILGPNGAGKTTFIRIIATLLSPTTGEGQIFGVPLRDYQTIREMLGLPAAVFWILPSVDRQGDIAVLCAPEGGWQDPVLGAA